MRYLLIALMLSGCATQERIEAARQIMLDNASKNCTQMGFKNGTSEHSTCQLELVKSVIAGQTAIAAGAAARPLPTFKAPVICNPTGNGGSICQ